MQFKFRPTWQKIKHMPPELVPLALVMVLGLGAAGFSMTYKLLADPTLRLSRPQRTYKPVLKNPEDFEDSHGHGH